MNIPREFQGSIYAYYNIQYGYFMFSDKDNWGVDGDVLSLGKVADVDVQFPDARQAVADSIDAKIESVRAELTNRIAILQGQKASLLAIECDQ